LAFAGGSPATVMNALGHASAALSLEVYAKVVAGVRRASAKGWRDSRGAVESDVSKAATPS